MISEHWKLVPREALDEMWGAGSVVDVLASEKGCRADADDVYDAMLSAAPSAPTEAVEGVIEAAKEYHRLGERFGPAPRQKLGEALANLNDALETKS